MANLPLAFAEILAGGIIVTAGITGNHIKDVMTGDITTGIKRFDGGGSSTSSPGSAGTLPLGPASGGKISTGGSLLTSGQKTFASYLARYTGLNINVVEAWVLAEESGSAAVARQNNGNHDWLNIGYTDSKTFGASNSVWSDPKTAARATAQWLSGQWSDPGFGTASSGIQHILSTAGQSASAQIAALQHSGWASSGYPGLDTIYQEVINTP